MIITAKNKQIKGKEDKIGSTVLTTKGTYKIAKPSK